MPFDNIQTKTSINWENDIQKQREWTEAKLFFEQNPDKEKLRHHRQSAKKGNQDHHDISSHSFIQAQTDSGVKVLAVNAGYLGKGGMGRATLAEDENGHLYVLKMQTASATISKKDLSELAKNEATNSKIAGASIASFDRLSNNREKHYIVYEYFGENLSKYLEHAKGSLSKTDQLDLAIQVFIQIKRLHDLGLSHGDIKPDNFAIQKVNGKLKVNAIDFGFSSEVVHLGSNQGTPLYVPRNIGTESHEILDLYAGLRTAGLSSSIFQYGDGWATRGNYEDFILSQRIIDRDKNINEIVDFAAGDQAFLPANTHADDIACWFILERNKIYNKKNLDLIKAYPEIKSQLINEYNNQEDIDQQFLNQKKIEIQNNISKCKQILASLGCDTTNNRKLVDAFSKVRQCILDANSIPVTDLQVAINDAAFKAIYNKYQDFFDIRFMGTNLDNTLLQQQIIDKYLNSDYQDFFDACLKIQVKMQKQVGLQQCIEILTQFNCNTSNNIKLADDFPEVKQCILDANRTPVTDLQALINDVAFQAIYKGLKSIVGSSKVDGLLGNDLLRQKIIDKYLEKSDAKIDQEFYYDAYVLKKELDLKQCEEILTKFDCNSSNNIMLTNDFPEVRQCILDANLTVSTNKAILQALINDEAFEAIVGKLKNVIDPLKVDDLLGDALLKQKIVEKYLNNPYLKLDRYFFNGCVDIKKQIDTDKCKEVLNKFGCNTSDNMKLVNLSPEVRKCILNQDWSELEVNDVSKGNLQSSIKSAAFDVMFRTRGTKVYSDSFKNDIINKYLENPREINSQFIKLAEAKDLILSVIIDVNKNVDNRCNMLNDLKEALETTSITSSNIKGFLLQTARTLSNEENTGFFTQDAYDKLTKASALLDCKSEFNQSLVCGKDSLEKIGQSLHSKDDLQTHNNSKDAPNHFFKGQNIGANQPGKKFDV